MVGGQRYGGGRVAARRLGQNVCGREFGKLLGYQRTVDVVGDNENPFGAFDQRQHSVEGHLQE